MRKLIALIIGILALAAQGRTATDFFTGAPDAALRLIPQSTRLDMVDYFNYGSSRASENYFGGEARIKKITENVIDFQIDDGVEMQIAVIPAKNDTIIATITTLHLPVADSDIKFYNADWKPLRKTPFEMPAYESWITPQGSENMADIALHLPFIPVSASFDDTASALTLTDNAADYLSKDKAREFAPWLIESKIYDVKSAQFLPRK